MDFAKQMKKVRKERKLSQEEVAEALGISRQAVAKWESGQSGPDLDNLLLLSSLFQCTADRLLKEPENCAKQLATPDPENQEALKMFLCKAKRNGYAAKAAEEETPSRPAAHDISYREGDFFYLDTFLGGEQFAGEEGVWLNGTPLWVMNYVGRVLGEGFSGDFLKDALLQVPSDAPYRGPALYQDGDYTYTCSFSGDFSWYQGREEIFCQKEKVYECFFHGGKIR